MNMANLEDILGFSKHEKTVWNNLNTHGQIIAELTRATKLPRMTVHKIARRLVERGLAVRKKRNKRFYYHKIDSSVITKVILESELQHTHSDSMGISGIVVHAGVSNMLQLIDHLADAKQVRWSLMQSTMNAEMLTKKVPREKIELLNKKIARNQQITDLYIEKGMLSHIAKHYTETEKQSWLTSIERMAVIHVLPPGTLTAKTDLILQQGKAYLLDWEAEVIFEIQHSETVKMYNNFLDMLAQLAPKTTNMKGMIESISPN